MSSCFLFPNIIYEVLSKFKDSRLAINHNNKLTTEFFNESAIQAMGDQV